MHAHTFRGRNVNHIFPIAILMFKQGWNTQHTVGRGDKKMIEHHGPVITTYQYPCERVLFDVVRDAHPFFHFFDSLWMLAGREDVKWLAFFLKNITQFSDDGKVFHGSYGRRLRYQTEDEDQLFWVVDHLSAEPTSRRAVITMFDAELDHREGKDIPCNLSRAFQIRKDALHLTVFNRSNDMVWGAYGANVVQFSTVLEYVAGCLGVAVGTYTQVSNNFHVYEDEPTWQRIRDRNLLVVLDPYEEDVYDALRVEPYDMFTGASAIRGSNSTVATSSPLWRQMQFDKVLQKFMADSEQCMDNGTMLQMANYIMAAPYFHQVVVPLFNSFQCYKQKRFDDAMEWLQGCKAQDWKLACEMWLTRRIKK